MKRMYEAIISVNSVCNLHCRMCRIWQKNDKTQIPPEIYKRLPSSLRKVTITGGEPFLDVNLKDRYRYITQQCPFARIIICTNAFQPEIIADFVNSVWDRSRPLGFRLSLDGPANIHDMIRGQEGVYNKVLKTTNLLKELDINDIGFSFTLMPQNLGTIQYVANLAKKLDVDIVCNVVQNSSLYYGKDDNHVSYNLVEQDLKWLENRLIHSRYWKNWFRAYFTSALLQYLHTRKRPLACSAGQDFFYLHNNGDVYACTISNERFGNILNENIEQIVSNSNVQKRLPLISKCQKCWTSCNLSAMMHKRPFYIFKKVVAKKIHAIIAGK